MKGGGDGEAIDHGRTEPRKGKKEKTKRELSVD